MTSATKGWAKGNVEAGKKSQINWSSGDWVFLDIGFSQKKPSCGFLVGDKKPELVRFEEAKKRVVDIANKSSRIPLNLVIEAPLSICFDSIGNPTGRSIEKEGDNHRYWYEQSGCRVMVAAMYLIRDLYNIRPKVPIRLFEGFISFQEKGNHWNHKDVVNLLREMVRKHKKYERSFYPKESLKKKMDDQLMSAFCVAGMDCGIPVVIKG